VGIARFSKSSAETGRSKKRFAFGTAPSLLNSQPRTKHYDSLRPRSRQAFRTTDPDPLTFGAVAKDDGISEPAETAQRCVLDQCVSCTRLVVPYLLNVARSIGKYGSGKMGGPPTDVRSEAHFLRLSICITVCEK
jgi:hypothetical protein